MKFHWAHERWECLDEDERKHRLNKRKTVVCFMRREIVWTGMPDRVHLLLKPSRCVRIVTPTDVTSAKESAVFNEWDLANGPCS